MALVKRLQYAIELESAAYPFDRDKQACHAIGAVVSILRAVRAEHEAVEEQAAPPKESAAADKITKLRALVSPETLTAINKHLEHKANDNQTK